MALRGTGRGLVGDKSTTHSRLEALDAARESAECSVDQREFPLMLNLRLSFFFFALLCFVPVE